MIPLLQPSDWNTGNKKSFPLLLCAWHPLYPLAHFTLKHYEVSTVVWLQMGNQVEMGLEPGMKPWAPALIHSALSPPNRLGVGWMKDGVGARPQHTYRTSGLLVSAPPSRSLGSPKADWAWQGLETCPHRTWRRSLLSPSLSWLRSVTSSVWTWRGARQGSRRQQVSSPALQNPVTHVLAFSLSELHGDSSTRIYLGALFLSVICTCSASENSSCSL